MSQMASAKSTAMPRFVSMVLSHGMRPSLVAPTGSRCWSRNRKLGPSPNITSGWR